MSHTVEVCVKYNGTLEELKADVERILGMRFPRYECPTDSLRAYYGKLLTIDVQLSINYLEKQPSSHSISCFPTKTAMEVSFDGAQAIGGHNRAGVGA